MKILETKSEIALFYDALAGEYDTMTEFQKRFVTERPYFRVIVDRYDIKTAIDAGSGTGFHSLVLAQLGARVIGVDASQAMLDGLRHHAQQMYLSIETVQADFETLSDTLEGEFDAVFCLGNSLAHLLSTDQLVAALGNFKSLLNPDGLLIIQMLNYDRILSRRERVQSVKQIGDTTFTRYYEYEDKYIRFNILRQERKSDAIEETLNTITLNPLRKKELEGLLKQAGFADISFFGGISLEHYVEETSKDLVVIARRGPEAMGTTARSSD